MTALKQFYVLAFATILIGTLPACAVYRKCGFAGCAGDAQIRRHPVLEPPNLLHVQTLDHVVYLTGQVDTELERSLAESVARDVVGVTRVVNSINFSYEGR